MILNLLISLTYLYFHLRYFKLIEHTFQHLHHFKRLIGITFFLNFSLFYICTVLQLNLIINWILFFIFLFGETVIFCKKDWRVAFFFALSGILFGLSINILCRCIISILLNLPPSVFDNHVLDDSNMKSHPIFWGFLLGGLALHLMATSKSIHYLRTLISHPEHLAFQLDLMTAMFVYLTLNLLLYQSNGNSLLLKLWGIKSCVFALAGFYLGLRYSLIMCRLSDYREANSSIQHKLTSSEQKEARLRTIAYKDALTETYNRLYALDYLQTLMRQSKPFTLCFIDLNDLKGVNDRYGHSHGDLYLTSVAHVLAQSHREGQDLLARFGGDEFLLLFQDVGVSMAEQRLENANQSLRSISDSEGLPFPMSISYGVVDSRGHDSVDALIDAADDAMYQRKRKAVAAPKD